MADPLPGGTVKEQENTALEVGCLGNSFGEVFWTNGDAKMVGKVKTDDGYVPHPMPNMEDPYLSGEENDEAYALEFQEIDAERRREEERNGHRCHDEDESPEIRAWKVAQGLRALDAAPNPFITSVLNCDGDASRFFASSPLEGGELMDVMKEMEECDVSCYPIHGKVDSPLLEGNHSPQPYQNDELADKAIGEAGMDWNASTFSASPAMERTDLALPTIHTTSNHGKSNSVNKEGANLSHSTGITSIVDGKVCAPDLEGVVHGNNALMMMESSLEGPPVAKNSDGPQPGPLAVVPSVVPLVVEPLAMITMEDAAFLDLVESQPLHLRLPAPPSPTLRTMLTKNPLSPNLRPKQ